MPRKKSKKNLSIAQIHWAFEPTIGGVETHLKLMLPEMVKKGHEVSLLTCDVAGAPEKETMFGVKVFRTPYLNLDLLMRMEQENIEKNLKELYRKFILDVKPDVIHVHNMHYFSKVHIKMLEYVAEQKNIPIVLTAHNVWDDNLYLDIINDVNWAHIIAVSHYIKRELWGVGIPDEKLTAIHHGIDTQTYKTGVDTSQILKKYPMLKGKRIVFHPARMSVAKGCDVSVKAMNLVRRHYKDTVLILAGTRDTIDWTESKDRDLLYIKNLIKEFKMEKQVLIDSFTQTEMIQLYNLSEICLYPSRNQEPFGLTMLESQACGVPIIVTFSGGMTEVIHDRINGFVVPTGDFSQIAFRVMFALGDSHLREMLGRTGRQIVKYHYTKDIMIDRTIEIYRHVLGDIIV